MKHLSALHKLFSTNKKGFTLIELAMVMIIVGLLLTIGMNLVGPLTKRAKLIEARERVKAAKETVTGWTVKKGYANITSTGGINTDSYGKEIAYVFAPEIGTGLNACRTIGVNNRTTLNVCLNGDCATQRISNIAFVVISGGDNFNIQTWTSTGGACPGGETCVLVYAIMDTPNVDDCTDARGCPSPATQANDPDRPEAYDDVVQYVTLDEVRTMMNCSQPLAITSPATLPQGEEDTFYTYTLQATGGRPPYTWSPLWSVPFGLAMNPPGPGLISGTINVNGLTSTGELAACLANIAPPAPGTVTVTDSVNATATLAINIPVRPKPLLITNTEMPTAKLGTPYTVTLNGTGGNATTYTWTLAAGVLPAGLNLVAGQITGTPTGLGSGFTIQLADPCLTTVAKSFTITVNP